ncbi:MAG: hypothetical protein H6817_07895 [Phycisphaerales bacterium]|nr:hypothetical protein [Phycisphaerales bacterium]
MTQGPAGISEPTGEHTYNGTYSGRQLDRIAFPIGGIGAGMVCLTGTGALTHVSVRNRMDFFNEPCAFAAVCIRQPGGNIAKVLEGPVPTWKVFGNPSTGNGATGTTYGLPRFADATFLARFPFATVALADADVPLRVELTGWSPFIPGYADDSSLPVGALEYRFTNTGDAPIDAVYSHHAKNFMATGKAGGDAILPTGNGFILAQSPLEKTPEYAGSFAVFTDDDATVVDHGWFKGGWWDALTLAWASVAAGRMVDNPPSDGPTPGASLYVPFTLRPGESRIIRVMFAWYVPHTELHFGSSERADASSSECCTPPERYVPWYAGKFASAGEIVTYWRTHYDRLRDASATFRDAFYDSTLPPEVIEAVTANLTILKSPTVLRQADGRLWGFEGCGDDGGCCHGSCTHVWNYAQAICHLFPDLERTLRHTEFEESQDDRGHQSFRADLPIHPTTHAFHAAADGQLGGVIKVYRDWRICGDGDWLREFWPRVRRSLDYCIATWDPRGCGAVEEPHHNTYDIEFWGPNGHCTSFYVAALTAAVEMGTFLGDDVSRYRALRDLGCSFLERELYNGEYFFQRVRTSGLNAKFEPLDATQNGAGYREIIATINEQGPKYQYGTGCLSDGVLGLWMARVCGLDADIVDRAKVRSNLQAIHRYNLRRDLHTHANPQRPAYALGREGGLLLCTWPRGGKPELPFVYSDEVWTGIEYQVASHLMMAGLVDEGLEIVRICRDRYAGDVRNPFNEYECGHWYVRALASYALLQGLTGARYDAVTQTLHIDSRIGGNFRSFLATATGFGTVGLADGKPFLDVKQGTIDVKSVLVAGMPSELDSSA